MENIVCLLSAKTKRCAYLIIFIVTNSLFLSQTFDFERAWGTYYGPAGTDYFTSIIDNQTNLHLLGEVQIDNNLNAAYYNQYVTTGGQQVNLSFNNNIVHSQFSGNGLLLASDYRGGSNLNNNGISEYLVHISGDGSHYYLKISSGNLTDVATSNAWFVNDPITTAGQPHSLLYKKDNAGNVLWITYLPGNLQNDKYSFVSDENNQLFIYGSTYSQQGITTSGVFRENFQVHYENGSLRSNAFIAKIGNQGQLVWGTYLPTNSTPVLEYFNQTLYVIGAGDINPSVNQLSTTNAWQTNPTNSSLTVFNSQTGMRSWGTYIGPGSLFSGTVSGLKVNSAGIYLLGSDFNTDGSNYFATPGAYKVQVTGLSDYFITKLSLNGNRIWGTYFGSDGYEHTGSVSNRTLALTDQALFISGSTFGGGSNIATSGSFLDTPPATGSQSNNCFFAQFDLNGNLRWSSYYGGSNTMIYNQSFNIVAKDHSSFYLYGSTRSATGIATPGAVQSQLPANLGQYGTGFVARFNYKGELSLHESVQNKEIRLYDNPNNGDFNIKGEILSNESTSVKIIDGSGRLVYEGDMPKQETVHLKLRNRLAAGLYFVQILGQKNGHLKTFKMNINK